MRINYLKAFNISLFLLVFYGFVECNSFRRSANNQQIGNNKPELGGAPYVSPSANSKSRSYRSNEYNYPRNMYNLNEDCALCSLFTPKEPNTFGYHFHAYTNYPYAYFYPNSRHLFKTNSESLVIPSSEPIFYNYNTKIVPSDEFDSYEIDHVNADRDLSPNNIDNVVVGVENVLVMASVGSGQHITLNLRQGSDGLEPIYVADIKEKITTTTEASETVSEVQRTAADTLAETRKLLEEFLKHNNVGATVA